MTVYVPMPVAEPLAGLDELVMAAMRCWRAARDMGAPVQQSLYALLSPRGCGIFAPVFDGLLTVCEAALGRRFTVGEAALSEDEYLLLSLLDGSQPPGVCIACTEGLTSALACAVRSTRIMFEMTFGRPMATTVSHTPHGWRLPIERALSRTSA